MTDDQPPLRSKAVTYDVEDIIALSKLVPRTPIHLFRIAAGSIVILLMFLVVGEAYALTGILDWPAIVACLFVAAMVFLLTNRRVRAHLWLKLQKRSALHGGHVFEVSPGALLISSPKVKSEIPWTTFIDVKIADSRLFLFMSKRLAYVIPRRAFDSDAEFGAFAAAAQERWAGASPALASIRCRSRKIDGKVKELTVFCLAGWRSECVPRSDCGAMSGRA